MRDGRLSSRTPNVGSCTTGRAPAPSAPIAISTVPAAPNRRVRRITTTSASLSGDPTVRSSPCQRPIEAETEAEIDVEMDCSRPAERAIRAD
jgi:hypothetical protein